MYTSSNSCINIAKERFVTTSYNFGCTNVQFIPREFYGIQNKRSRFSTKKNSRKSSIAVTCL